ncbi:MAG: arginine--tRNA ligase [Acidobacteriota bacterium]|nr:arginine--tRNA ligase [Acidobacteriota bacterium]MDH3785710.1 arginine--tRNA ligase [Acidobacteriota bacterium]
MHPDSNQPHTQTPEDALRRLLQAAIRDAWQIDDLALDSIPLTYPPKAELGDLASPICFELARRLRKAPREIATSIVDKLSTDGTISRVEVAGGGYLNAYLDRDGLIAARLRETPTDAKPTGDHKTIVEHTNINPNKAAHIGHLRNAVLGDTLVRFLRRLGARVETQNYIDDTGVQVADLVVGFRFIREMDLEAVQTRYSADELDRRGERFDYVAWDLYAQVTKYYDEDAERLEQRKETLHLMEQGDNAVAELAAFVARRMVQHHLTTMSRLGIRYDILPHESDILRHRFWEHAFERLKSLGAIQQAASGKNQGCWVMDLEGVDEGSGEDQKVIVRSDGTVTYVGKDIAYQMWKFGLLGRDFAYTSFNWSPQRACYDVWTTTHPTGDEPHPAFGAARTVYNVIDIRQAFLQRVVKQALRQLGHTEEAERSIHYSYEMVALSPAAVEAMFPAYALSDEERAKAYLEMSGRKGLGLRADDLLDALIQRAGAEVAQRNADLGDDASREIAEQIAIGALRYYMLRFSRNRVVAFDLDAALAFEGETGPYLQYTVLRARNILRKAVGEFGEASQSTESLTEAALLDALPEESRADHWNLVLQLLRVPATLRQAVDSLELSSVAKHAYVLAQAFNSFYHRYPAIKEPDPSTRQTRLAVIRIFHDGMVDLLSLMGVPVPDRM